MSIPEPTLVIYGELPRAIATTDLRQARVDEFLASRSLQPKSRKAYQADLRIFMDWCDLAWVDVSRRKVTQFKTFLLKERELALSSVNRVQRTLKSFYRWMLLSEYVVADPTIGIQQERLPDPVAKDLEDEEVLLIYSKYLSNPPQNNLPKRLKADTTMMKPIKSILISNSINSHSDSCIKSLNCTSFSRANNFFQL